jgi:N-acyl homoserine lactone hydrolase
MAPGDLDGRWAVCPFPGFLFELSDGRRVLVDNGPNRRHIDEPMYEYGDSEFVQHLKPMLTREDDPANRLAELNLTVDDIDLLVLTHTHFDHAGNTADFTASEIVVHRDAWHEGIERFQRGERGGIPETGADGTPLNYRLIDGDTELAPGLILLHTPGHAVGHLSVLLRLPETGAVILAIDAIYSRVNRERENYKIGADPKAGARSAARLLDIADQEQALLIYGHDPEQWATLRKAPASYT